MELKQVSREEVKVAFMCVNLFREIFAGRESESIPRSELENHYHNTRNYLEGLTEKGISHLMKNQDPVRLARYDSLEWYFGEVEFERMGSWPRMYGLDIRFTIGNIPETARKVKGVINGTYSIPFSEKAQRKFPGQLREVEFNYEHFPIILFPGGTVREEDYNSWARERNKLLCKIFEFDVDDGNGRAISQCISGKEKARAYIGRRD
jgi:hypothetical protein